MIPYGRQDISEEDIDAVVDVLKSDFLTQGPMVPRFESSVAHYCNAEFSVAVSNGTAALHIACIAMGVGPGDIVWTSATTFVASANCALYCGASVDFVDIDPNTYNIDISALKAKLESAEKTGKLPKIIIPVHLCGQSCDMQTIRSLSLEYGFKVIEDASHAVGGKYRNAPVGNCNYSDITVFSFHPVKIVTSGEGGMALTNDPEVANQLRLARNHGITTDKGAMESRPEEEIWNYQQVSLGYNYRLTDLQAALGVSQMNRLDEFVEERRELARKYDEALDDIPLKLPYQHPDSYSSYHLYPIRVNRQDAGKSQREVYQTLLDAGIAANLHYIPVYRHPYYEALGFNEGYCPQAELYHREAITLPLYPRLNERRQGTVIQVLRSIF